MARSRNIKPAFFLNDELSECDPYARLLFISLWTLCDREGRMKYRPRKIRAEAFPYEPEINIEEKIEQLSTRGFVFIYESLGQKILQVNNWNKHQNPHHKEVESELPRYEKSTVDSSIIHGQVNHDPNTVCDGYTPLSNTMRQKIFSRDGRQCRYCKATEKLHIDHIIPVSRGGNSVEENLQVLCGTCNSMKSNKKISQEASIKHGQVILESSTDHPSLNKDASCPTDSLLLIPDSLLPNKTNGDLSPSVIVFDYWVSVMDKPKSAKLTKERKRLIDQRIKEKYTVDDIKRAIDGCRASEFHMGKNDSGKVHNDLTLICRNGSKLEQFMDSAGKPKSSKGQQFKPSETKYESGEL